MPPEPKHAGGRPSKYRPEFCAQAEKLCQFGAIDAELASFFEVNVDTIHEWKHVHPEFSDALKSGKLIADAEVANKLYRRACGYSHDAVRHHVIDKTVVETPYVEHYAPDTVAAIFWLKNRAPRKWRDKTDQFLVVEEKQRGPNLSGLTREERDELVRLLKKGEEGPSDESED